MGSTRVTVRIGAFLDEGEIDLAFPGKWTVEQCRMEGHDRPALSDEELRLALRTPYGAPQLRELVRPDSQVCILFDDLSKPTPTSRIIPFILEELAEKGLADDQIRFLCAPGTHRPMIYPEFEAKLGKEVMERFMVYNHSIWENVVHMGQTSRGTPVYVNREYASCDVRIGIGCIMPHLAAGFGGGGKIVMPGVSGIDTITYHHKNMRDNSEAGRIDDNKFRLDLEEAARLAGLQFKVDVVLNNRREISGLFAGDFVEEHRAGVALARRLYSTELARGADVVVVNSYPVEVQFIRSCWFVPYSLRDGGDVVLLTHSRDGEILHQLAARFGTNYGGRHYKAGSAHRDTEKAARVLVMGPHLSRYDRNKMGPTGKVVWCRTWGEVLGELAARHGPGTRVAVYPYSPFQLPSHLNMDNQETSSA